METLLLNILCGGSDGGNDFEKGKQLAPLLNREVGAKIGTRYSFTKVMMLNGTRKYIKVVSNSIVWCAIEHDLLLRTL